MKFIHKNKEPELKPLKKKKNWKLRAYIVTLLTFSAFVFLFGLLVNEYINTHTFQPQSPIILRTPVIIKRIEIISPLASKSGNLGMVYAQEVENPYNPESPKGIAWTMSKEKFGISSWGSLEELIRRESNWNPYSINQSSGAKGMFQSLGHSDYTCENWEVKCQIEWGLNYIENRYGNPDKALNFHDEKGWY
jgi:hypothetical protein